MYLLMSIQKGPSTSTTLTDGQRILDVYIYAKQTMQSKL